MAAGGDDQAKAKRAAKRGAVKAAERERVAQDAATWSSSRDGQQWPLFELTQPGEQLPDDDKAPSAGRPVGARTASPLEYRRYILSTKGDFLARFVGIAQADTLELARLLQCKPLEALAIQQKLGATAAPYIYTPQRPPIDGDPAAYFAGLVFLAGNATPAPGSPLPAGASSAVAALAGRPPDMQEIQPLAPVEFVGSEPPHSEEDDEAP